VLGPETSTLQQSFGTIILPDPNKNIVAGVEGEINADTDAVVALREGRSIAVQQRASGRLGTAWTRSVIGMPQQGIILIVEEPGAAKGRGRSKAELYKQVGDSMELVATSINGSIPTPAPSPAAGTRFSAGARSSGAGEYDTPTLGSIVTTASDPCGGCAARYTENVCDFQWSWSCGLGAAGCVGCAAACITGPWTCSFCVATSCVSTWLGCCGTGKPMCVDCGGSGD
jgi:hypothetical protein